MYIVIFYWIPVLKVNSSSCSPTPVIGDQHYYSFVLDGFRIGFLANIRNGHKGSFDVPLNREHLLIFDFVSQSATRTLYQV